MDEDPDGDQGVAGDEEAMAGIDEDGGVAAASPVKPHPVKPKPPPKGWSGQGGGGDGQKRNRGPPAKSLPRPVKPTGKGGVRGVGGGRVGVKEELEAVAPPPRQAPPAAQELAEHPQEAGKGKGAPPAPVPMAATPAGRVTGKAGGKGQLGGGKTQRSKDNFAAPRTVPYQADPWEEETIGRPIAGEVPLLKRPPGRYSREDLKERLKKWLKDLRELKSLQAAWAYGRKEWTSDKRTNAELTMTLHDQKLTPRWLLPERAPSMPVFQEGEEAVGVWSNHKVSMRMLQQLKMTHSVTCVYFDVVPNWWLRKKHVLGCKDSTGVRGRSRPLSEVEVQLREAGGVALPLYWCHCCENAFDHAWSLKMHLQGMRGNHWKERLEYTFHCGQEGSDEDSDDCVDDYFFDVEED